VVQILKLQFDLLKLYDFENVFGLQNHEAKHNFNLLLIF
jgi:hypothetical protein